jgi:DNA-binding response OmpR family regulator
MEDKKKVLIVEDEEDICKLLKANLIAIGYDTIEAGTIEDSRKILKTDKPDVIILDVMLPDGNGFDFCKEIKDQDEFLKVIIYTGKLEAVDARRAREAGADDFTVKTVDFKYISESIEKLLS